MTLQLDADQYERLFFQPSQAKGDLARRLGNPTLLGILGFNIPFTATVFCLLQYQGSSVMSLTAISGSYYFMGGIALNIAGLAEFILGNTFPMVAFIIYGCHWLVLAYISDPLHGIVNSYGGDGAGALAQEYLAGQGNYYVVMALVSFIFMCGSLRTNVPFVIMFTCLVFLFSFIAAANYQLGYNPSAAGFEHAVHYLKIAGGFGFGTMILGWYLAIITVCASTGVPCPLPIFDLSQKVLAHNTAAQKAEHAGMVTQDRA